MRRGGEVQIAIHLRPYIEAGTCLLLVLLLTAKTSTHPWLRLCFQFIIVCYVDTCINICNTAPDDKRNSLYTLT